MLATKAGIESALQVIRQRYEEDTADDTSTHHVLACLTLQTFSSPISEDVSLSLDFPSDSLSSILIENIAFAGKIKKKKTEILTNWRGAVEQEIGKS